MKNQCTNPKLGEMIHAYELNALSEEKRDQFEIHLLECESCFEEVRSFEARADIILNDPEVRRDLKAAAVETSGENIRTGIFRRFLWPEAPFILRPAVAFILILLLLYPAYLGLRRSSNQLARPVVSVGLFPTRSNGIEAVSVTPGMDLVVSFVYHGATPGTVYRVNISDESGLLVFHDDNYSDFDRYEIGNVLVPGRYLHPGKYVVTIAETGGKRTDGRQVYEFRIEIENK